MEESNDTMQLCPVSVPDCCFHCCADVSEGGEDEDRHSSHTSNHMSDMEGMYSYRKVVKFEVILCSAAKRKKENHLISSLNSAE